MAPLFQAGADRCFMPGSSTAIVVSALYLGARAASGASKSNAAGSASAETLVRNLQIPQTKASIVQQPRTRFHEGDSEFTMEDLTTYEEHMAA
ncbi:hypothetical protein GQ607_016381 [Colletotrichum asianum]|uniref:Uncharacterized protein n=1 Tax=Colletotrichum asianum TaxID=702518 RepID=A0A8H3ZLV3_9PEZI|nr:hypothetical protein GQ607_016381 [Colletotrichum asianum]